jgi:cystathionine gamma-synthase
MGAAKSYTATLLGADVVMHSGTKYFGGHSDICWDAQRRHLLLYGRTLGASIRTIQTTLGSTASPFDCCLKTFRGLRTRQCETAENRHISLQP